MVTVAHLSTDLSLFWAQRRSSASCLREATRRRKQKWPMSTFVRMFKRWNLEWWVVCSKTHVWEHNSKGIHLPGYLPKQGSLRSEESKGEWRRDNQKSRGSRVVPPSECFPWGRASTPRKGGFVHCLGSLAHYLLDSLPKWHSRIRGTSSPPGPCCWHRPTMHTNHW